MFFKLYNCLFYKNGLTITYAKNINLPLMIIAKDARVALDKIQDNLSNAVASDENSYLEKAEELAFEVKKLLAEANEISSKIDESTQHLEQPFIDYYSVAYLISSEMLNGEMDFSTLGARTSQMQTYLEIIQNNLNNYSLQKENDFNDIFTKANESVKINLNTGLVFGVITVALLLVSIPIALSIRKNLTQIMLPLKRLAQGSADLTDRITSDSKDEVGQLVYWFNRSLDKQQELVKSIVATAKPLAELATDINELSGSTQKVLLSQKGSV